MDLNLTPRKMCAECDVFLGKEHRIGCSLSGEVVAEQCEEKFTSVEHAAEEDGPLLGLDTDAVELVLRHLAVPAGDDFDSDDFDKVAALREGLKKFLDEAR